MHEHQPHEFLTRVTRCADDSNLNYLCVHSIWNSGNQEQSELAKCFPEFPISECKLRKAKAPRLAPAGLRKFFSRLTLAELEAFARAGLAVLLALLHPRVAREKAIGLQNRTQVRVRFEQCASDSMTNRAGLTGRTATTDIHTHVELVRRFRPRERRRDHTAQRIGRKIVFKSAAIDSDLARAHSEAHARH